MKKSSSVVAVTTVAIALVLGAIGTFHNPKVVVRTSVPVIYKMFGWGEQPDSNYGEINFFLWDQMNPSEEQYNWSRVDLILERYRNQVITLRDGSIVPKPVQTQLLFSLSSSDKAGQVYTDYTPQWVYSQIGQGSYKIQGCGAVAVVPRYDSDLWQKAYFAAVQAFADHIRLTGIKNVVSVVIPVGLDGETQLVKDMGCNWNELLDHQYSIRYSWSANTFYRKGFIYKCIDVYRKAFPKLDLYVNAAPTAGLRMPVSEYCLNQSPPIGLKHSGVIQDMDSVEGRLGYVGSWDHIKKYMSKVPIWLESAFGLGVAENRYWSEHFALHFHPDAIDFHPEYLTQSEPKWLDFVTMCLGQSAKTAPVVWTVMRDYEYPEVLWGTGGVSGLTGDYQFFVHRTSDNPRVLRESIPYDKNSVYSRQARTGTSFSFAIDDEWSSEGATFVFTILNTGAKVTFEIENGLVIDMGPATNKWEEITFGVLNPSKHFSITTDKMIYLHKVAVYKKLSVVPTTMIVTPTPIATPTPTPTPTPRTVTLEIYWNGEIKCK